MPEFNEYFVAFYEMGFREIIFMGKCFEPCFRQLQLEPTLFMELPLVEPCLCEIALQMLLQPELRGHNWIAAISNLYLLETIEPYGHLLKMEPSTYLIQVRHKKCVL